jgi:photosystem II stability/assembly factor-like uncharacterized protein
MKKSIIKLILIILSILITNGIVYSQVDYWEPTAKVKSSINSNKGGFLSVSDNGDIWLATIRKGIFYSTNNGDAWIQTTNNGLDVEKYIIAFAIEHPISGSIFIGGQKSKGTDNNGILFRLSSKYGEFWEKVLELPDYSPNSINIFIFTDMVVKASGDIYIVGEGFNESGIYYSSDNGDTWIEKAEGLPSNRNPVTGSNFVSFLSLALATDGTLYAAGRYGIYCLDDGEDTWVQIFDKEVRDMVVSSDGSIFAATVTSGVFKSTDKGATWRGNDKESYSVDRITYNSVTDHIFIAANDHNLMYISTDLGESWNSNIMSNLPAMISYVSGVNSFAVNPKTGQVFLSMYGGEIEVYRLKVTLKEDIEFFLGKGSNASDIEFIASNEELTTVLLENYPNPFNPITSIQYHLGENSLVTLKVYDVMGRELETLINNKMQLKGIYNASFNASGLPSGIYFYTLFANGKPYTQKMLLMK